MEKIDLVQKEALKHLINKKFSENLKFYENKFSSDLTEIEKMKYQWLDQYKKCNEVFNKNSKYFNRK